MNDDELKAIWKTSNERMHIINLNSINMNVMNQAMKNFENIISRRNTREISFYLIGIVVFSILAYTATEPLKKLGAILLVASAIGVIYFIRKPKEKQPRFDITSSIRKQLLDYQEYVRAERKLLENIFYWCLLPTLPGAILFILGLAWIWQAKLMYFIFILIIFMFVYKLNQKAIVVKMNPLLNDIDKTLKSLEDKE